MYLVPGINYFSDGRLTVLLGISIILQYFDSCNNDTLYQDPYLGHYIYTVLTFFLYLHVCITVKIPLTAVKFGPARQL